MNDQEFEAYVAEIQRRRKIIFRTFLILIVVLTAGGIGIWKFILSPTQSILGSSTALTDQQIIQKVGSHIVLPAGETPKIVTVANVDDLKKTQSFFSNASNGDKLLIYSTKVVIYSVVADRVIDIAQIRYTPDGKK